MTKALPFLLLACILSSAPGCSTIDRNADPIVVSAERTVRVALITFDSFLKIERDNEAQLRQINPMIHEAAEKIRHQAPNWIRDTRNLTRTYKQNRTINNKATLDTALIVLEAGVKEAEKYMVQTRNSSR